MSEPEHPRLSTGIRMSMEGLCRWIDCYDADRPHSALSGRTPDKADQGPSDRIGLAAMTLT